MKKIFSVCLSLIILFCLGSAVSADYDVPDFSEFPKSYRPLLKELYEQHPEWSFIPFETALSWDEVMEAEQEETRNLVPVSSDTNSTWKVISKQWFFEGDTNIYSTTSGSGWVQASDEVIAYFMDPRNFINEDDIFQFELLSFNPETQGIDGIEQILEGTYMHEALLEDELTYAEALMEIGERLDISPYHLASRLRQEQGAKGNPLISGEMEGFEGYYNYFNIGASGTTNADVYANGIKTAKERGWDTPYKAIEGGALELSKKYIARGQDTLYLQKFDVDKSFDGLYWHQYMQNLQAAHREGVSVKKTYQELDMLYFPFTFKIPVFEDMPDDPCPRPEGDYKPRFSVDSVKVKSGTVTAKYTITNSEIRDIAFTAALLIYDEDGALCGFECEAGELESGETATPKITHKNKNATDGKGFILKQEAK